ncbi:hypothetical protein V6N13_121293 [Hibiscus sabdariffa]
MCRRRATREDSPCPATITAIGNIDDDEGASSRGPVGPGDVEEPIGSEGNSPVAQPPSSMVGLPTRTRPPECLLGSGRSQADTYDRRRKDPHLIAPGERKFDRGLERRGGRKGSGWI